MVDIPNEIARKGLIYFPDFCQLVLDRFRNDGVEDESFRQNMFKVGWEDHLAYLVAQMLCGTDPHPKEYKAKKYKLDKHSLSKVSDSEYFQEPGTKSMLYLQEDFQHIMRNLPVPVEEEDIEEMFAFADTDCDGRLSYKVRAT